MPKPFDDIFFYCCITSTSRKQLKQHHRHCYCLSFWKILTHSSVMFCWPILSADKVARIQRPSDIDLKATPGAKTRKTTCRWLRSVHPFFLHSSLSPFYSTPHNSLPYTVFQLARNLNSASSQGGNVYEACTGHTCCIGCILNLASLNISCTFHYVPRIATVKSDEPTRVWPAYNQSAPPTGSHSDD